MKPETWITLVLILLLSGALIWFVSLPLVKIFFAMEGYAWPAGILAMVFIFNFINIPIPGFKIRGVQVKFNLSAFVLPIVMVAVTYNDIQPIWRWDLALIFVGFVVFYFLASKATPRGVEIYTLVINALAFGLVAYLHYIAEFDLRMLMWWCVVIQYGSLVIPDLYRGLVEVPRITDSTSISFGGAGNNDGLWTAPTTALIYAYAAQCWFWGDTDTLLPA